ncbi:hypothetical protein [Metabacillus sp. FJAT-52054]|uniref:ABC transporter permease n=1 Tax=Metabacillus sediminis TaxID=3117746 RepID=A0ABZ2NGD3_9BACI
MAHHWLTPEEAELKRQRKNKIISISIPLMAIILGALLTIIANSI